MSELYNKIAALCARKRNYTLQELLQAMSKIRPVQSLSDLNVGRKEKPFPTNKPFKKLPIT